MSKPDDEEKALLAFASVMIGGMIAALTSTLILGVSLLFLSASQSFGLSIVAFLPVCFLMARWNVRLYRRNKAKEEAAQ